MARCSSVLKCMHILLWHLKQLGIAFISPSFLLPYFAARSERPPMHTHTYPHDLLTALLLPPSLFPPPDIVLAADCILMKHTYLLTNQTGSSKSMAFRGWTGKYL